MDPFSISPRLGVDPFILAPQLKPMALTDPFTSNGTVSGVGPFLPIPQISISPDPFSPRNPSLMVNITSPHENVMAPVKSNGNDLFSLGQNPFLQVNQIQGNPLSSRQESFTSNPFY